MTWAVDIFAVWKWGYWFTFADVVVVSARRVEFESIASGSSLVLPISPSLNFQNDEMIKCAYCVITFHNEAHYIKPRLTVNPRYSSLFFFIQAQTEALKIFLLRRNYSNEKCFPQPKPKMFSSPRPVSKNVEQPARETSYGILPLCTVRQPCF